MQSRTARQRGYLLLFVVLSLLITACQPIQPAGAQAAALSEEAAFEKAAMGLEYAYQKEDLEATLAYYADDAISQPPGYRTDVGKDAIRASYQSFYETYDMKRDFKLAGLKIVGNTGTRFGEWTQVLTPKDGGEVITETGRCVVGFEKIDGEWKVTYEIWNTYPTE